eukprot:CAMPEP_0183439926 /NCGR_PEP_ID=MMETSP0370-20130417/79711_1 /TAXON_ID=268820 /ORGANISM="Peridinium aciculiferum, Strain PAER-2" /LENGTH=75 /DNA_ID=CAMNT_0025628577 /DNA_START=27 /DNA_END=255 /DNA_ORIENTATION=-
MSDMPLRVLWRTDSLAGVGVTMKKCMILIMLALRDAAEPDWKLGFEEGPVSSELGNSQGPGKPHIGSQWPEDVPP